MMGEMLSLPGPGEVYLAYLELLQPDEVVAELEQTLSPEEMARAGRFHFAEDACRFVVRRGVLRHLLGGLIGVSPADVCFAFGPQGKPRLAPPYDRSGVHFNLSDSGDMALLAWTIGAEIGVDLEQIRPMPDALALAQRFFAKDEEAWLRQMPEDERDTAFFRCWTCKEAVVKAMGDGLTAPLQSFVATHWTRPPVVRWVDVPTAPDHWTLHLPDAPEGWLAAVAASHAIDTVKTYPAPSFATRVRGQ
ncbi:4'-phosphopantetheinyl transferase superfamily protein [bacterium]|nr:4'-phosphopantetheinyl transferase superfamily protein [bacterium]